MTAGWFLHGAFYLPGAKVSVSIHKIMGNNITKQITSVTHKLVFIYLGFYIPVYLFVLTLPAMLVGLQTFQQN